jgi:phage shock protein C
MVESCHWRMGLTEIMGGRILRIRRATRDRWVMGVCGGIAHTYGWNSNLVRLVTAVLAIAIPGFSLIPVILIYILLGVILEETQEY